MSRRSRRASIVVFVLTVSMLLAVAFAAWLANGTGSGFAEAGTAQELTTSEPPTTTGVLYPGGSGDLALTIDNPNPYPVTVVSVSGDGTITSDTTGCEPENHGVTFTDQTDLELQVPAEGSSSHVLAGAVAMGQTAADACQGATFTVPIALAGVSGWDGAGGGTPPPGDTAYYIDADGDGYGSFTAEPDYTGGPGYVDNAYDCDDSTSSIHPGATEIAGDGIDNDCDGVDDIPSCDDGIPYTIDTWDAGAQTCSHVADPEYNTDGDATPDVDDPDDDNDGVPDGEDADPWNPYVS
jgi:hypothetical protein